MCYQDHCETIKVLSKDIIHYMPEKAVQRQTPKTLTNVFYVAILCMLLQEYCGIRV